MAAVANNPAVAKKAKIPQSVGKEFMEADKGKKFKGGGEMKESKEMVKKEIGFMKKKGAPKSMIKHEMGEMGAMKKGGMPMVMKDGKKIPAFAAKKGGMPMKKMASGGMTSMGSVRTAAPSKDGVAQQGKTKGKQVVMAGNKRMNKGGRTC
jgi:hypothetical protein